ncbi:Lycopene beta cyclase [Hibiscus syriacus]|uniref:Lycopene beta cyclase n=1 Tax=Hibiscus syriacus TaxID=106335 RepID=A0A6A3B274_HIBSY|nr:Lycopene beta cyclase [Hibiscus syriacus]
MGSLRKLVIKTRRLSLIPRNPIVEEINNNGCVKVMSSRSALLEFVPETNKENLDVELPIFDPSKGTVVDLAVVGSGLAVSQLVSQAAMDLLDCLYTTWSGAVVYINEQKKKHLDRPYGRVNRKQLKSKMLLKCISNGVKFHQAEVIKFIHEESKSMLICNDGATVQATVLLDATGFSRCLVQYEKPYNPGYQVAYGILAEVEEHPFDVEKMVFMDWRDSHFANNDIKERMETRLRHLGIKVTSIEEDEHCVIPMGGPLPVLPQRVVGIGGTAGMVYPLTGYMVARTLAAAPIVADAIVRCLDPGRNLVGNKLSAEVWRDLWSIERRRQREFFCFGMDIFL